MGSWQATCGVSGLAIAEGDPVRISLISKAEFGMSLGIGPTRLYQFWFPLFKGKYNDYGTVSDKSIQPRELFDWLWGRFTPHLTENRRDREDKKPSLSDFVSDDRRVIRKQQNIADWEDNKPIYEKSNMEVHIWMCHEWAYQKLLKFDKSKCWHFRGDNLFEEQAEAFINWDYVPPGIEIGSKEWNKIVIATHMKEKYHIEQTFLSSTRNYVFNGPEDHLVDVAPKDFKQALADTAKFVNSLHFIRQGVVPIGFFGGEQYEDYTWLAPWTRTVAAKAKLYRKKRFEE